MMSNKPRLWRIGIVVVVVISAYLVNHFNDPQRSYRDSGKYSIFALEGQPAPAFSAKIVGKDANFTRDEVDRPTMFVFFGTFCPHCKSQMPEVRKIARKVGDEAHVFAVNSREFGNMALPEREKRVSDYLIEHSWADLPTLIASVEMQKALKLSAVPSVVVIDRDKTVTYVGLANHSASRLGELLAEAM